MHQVQVNVGGLQQIQALLQTLLGPGMECAPQLARDEKILPLHNATGDDILKRLADLVLVLVAVRTVNVSVSALDGVDDGLLDLTGGRLPRPQPQCGDGGAGV